MTTIERVEPQTQIAVAIVDTDVHPMPVSAEVLKSYAPADWVDKIWPTGNAVTPLPHFYDTPDSYKTFSMRVDAAPPGGGFAGTDPDYAAKQLLVDAGVGIATLEPMCDAQLPQAEHVLKSTYNDWLPMSGWTATTRTVAGADRSVSAHRCLSRRRGKSSGGPVIHTWRRS
jgi:hypothetical protein